MCVCVCVVTGYKIFFDQKELQIKKSSLLNVSNTNSKSETFSLEVLVDSEKQNWFMRAHLGKFWGLEKILMSVEGLDIVKCLQEVQ